MEVFLNARDKGLIFTEHGYWGETLIAELDQRLGERFCLYSKHGGAPYTLRFPDFGDRVKIMIHTDNEVFFDDSYYDCFDYVFRLYLHDRCDHVKVFPIPTGIQTNGQSSYDHGPNRSLIERKYDVFFRGQHWNRQAFKNALEKISISSSLIEFTDGFRGGSTFSAYNEILDDSKIILAPGGLSPETFRYNEAFARGCCVITDQPNGQWWHESSPAIFLRDWRQLEQAVEKLLSSLNGETHLVNRRYYETKLSPKAVADFIARTVLGTIKQPSQL